MGKRDLTEATEKKTRGARPLAITGGVLAIVLAGYLGLCGFAASRDTLWTGSCAMGQDLSGLTVSEAAETLESAFSGMEIGVYPCDAAAEGAERSEPPEAAIPVTELGASIDAQAIAQSLFDRNQGSFLTAGWRYLVHSGEELADTQAVTLDVTRTTAAAERVAQALSREAVNTAYELGEDSVDITLGTDGRSVDAAVLDQLLSDGAWLETLCVDLPYTVETAEQTDAQAIHDAVAGEMRNAGYDPVTKSIYDEQPGAEFDVAAAQKLMDAAQPGETVSVPATLEFPTVTAEQLRGVLFRDVLGTATTHVSGTSARISNVKLASSAVNGAVLNCGDVFSYNGTVGQRTAAKGYQAAPAYVQGETVDEIGGGVCQPSSTLYLACLNANLKIVERYAHRYVPAYIAKGMDATVSWGGPDYKFSNDTDYPIKIVASYSGGYLTMTIYGTKVDQTSVKMTNKVLSTTAWETVYQDDATLAPGTQQVKTTPYTGYKVETYRNVYDGNGKLISSRFEASSDYKVRNKVILKGPEAATPSGGGDTPVVGPVDPGTPTDPVTPTEPTTPTDPVTPTEPTTPEVPADPGTTAETE